MKFDKLSTTDLRRIFVLQILNTHNDTLSYDSQSLNLSIYIQDIFGELNNVVKKIIQKKTTNLPLTMCSLYMLDTSISFQFKSQSTIVHFDLVQLYRSQAYAVGLSRKYTIPYLIK